MRISGQKVLLTITGHGPSFCIRRCIYFFPQDVDGCWEGIRKSERTSDEAGSKDVKESISELISLKNF